MPASGSVPVRLPPQHLVLSGITHHFRPERLQQLVHRHRVELVVERRIRPHDLAAIVRGDLQSLERTHHLLPNRFQTHVVDQHVERMSHGGLAGVLQVHGRQRPIHRLLHLRIVLAIVLRLVQHHVTGAARRQQLMTAVLLRQRQVPRRQHTGLALVHRHVSRRATTVPVVQLLEFHPEVLHHRQQRLFVRAPEAFE